MSSAPAAAAASFKGGEKGAGQYTDPDGDRLYWAPYQRGSSLRSTVLPAVKAPGPAVSLRVVTEDGGDGTVHIPYEDIPELVASLIDAAVRAKKEAEK